MSLTNKVEQFNNDSDLVHAFAHGDKGTVIQTEGGSVPSMARLADGIQTRLNETIDQQRVLEQRLAANSGATLVKVSSGRTVQQELNGKANINGSSAQDFNTKTLYAAGNIYANAENFLQLSGKAVGAPTITVGGTDTDVGMYLGTKGGGRFDFRNAAGQHLQVGGFNAANPVVNSTRIYGGLAGGNPTFIAEGADANVGIDFGAKGAGDFFFRSNGGVQFQIRGPFTAVNNFAAYGAAAGGRPTLEARGTDTDVGLAYNAKGTGDHLFASGGRTGFQVAGTANSVNYIVATPSAAGTSPRFATAGSDVNVHMILAFKGTGQLFVDGALNLRGANGSTERRLAFATTTGNNYLYARDSDGVVGLYDVPGNVSPWFYTPATKTLTLGSGGVMSAQNLIIANRQETDLDSLTGSRFFGFAGTATGAPAATGGYDAVGLQMAGAGQRTQIVLAGEADGLMVRTDDSADNAGNNWGTWRKLWDSSTLTKLSQLQNDLPQSSVSGNWVPLADTNATTAVAEVGFYNIFSQFPEYDEFRLVFENAKNAVVADAVMGVRVSTNGTSAVTSTTYFNGVDGVHLSNSMWAITSSYVQSGAYEFLLPRVRDIAVSFWAAGTKADSSRLGVDRMGGSTLSSNLTLTGIGFVFNGTTGTGRFRVFGRKYA